MAKSWCVSMVWPWICSSRIHPSSRLKMAEFDLGDLWWMKKRDWLEEPNSALIGLQISQRQQQQNRDYALRLGEFGLRQKETAVQMHGQILSQQIKQAELDDESELNRAFAAKQAGQDVTPNLKLGSS